jgi:restriction system protein
MDSGQILFKTAEVMYETLITSGALLPIILFICFALLLKILSIKSDEWIKKRRLRREFQKGKDWRSDRALIQWLRGMSPTEFEKYIAWLFSEMGYKTKVVGGPGDGGIDVEARKDGKTHLIQCKKYFQNRSVGVSEIRDFYGAIADRTTDAKAFLITTNKFTLEAERFVGDKPIELIDAFGLAEHVRAVGKDSKRPPEDNGKKCPKCGGLLVQKSSKFGKFYGCSNYPDCKYTKEI